MEEFIIDHDVILTFTISFDLKPLPEWSMLT